MLPEPWFAPLERTEKATGFRQYMTGHERGCVCGWCRPSRTSIYPQGVRNV